MVNVCGDSISSSPTLLLIEPFYGGSHKQLIDLLQEEFSNSIKVTLPAKKWHWRARTSALYFSQIIPRNHSFRKLFCSSVLNLAELIALRPDLCHLKKIVYFHENQLIYPTRKEQERDFQYGYNQILTCLVADIVAFNSTFNMTSFLDNISSHMKLMPDFRPHGLAEQITPKCRVLYFPIRFPQTVLAETEKFPSADNFVETSPISDWLISRPVVVPVSSPGLLLDESEEAASSETLIGGSILSNFCNVSDSDANISNCDESVHPKSDHCLLSASWLHIVWVHRWEHDKNPELFFSVFYDLQNSGLPFCVSVLGEQFSEVPEIFQDAKSRLNDHIKHWGYLPSKKDYFDLLRTADVAISTSHHEFFGVAMCEAVYAGCYPLCPNRLVYPEIFPEECLYNTDQQLLKILKRFCKFPEIARRQNFKKYVEKFSWDNLIDDYRKLFHEKLEENS